MIHRQAAVLSIIFALVIIASLLATIANFFAILSHPRKHSLMLGSIESTIYRFIHEVSRDLEVVRGLRFVKPIEIKIINTSWAIEAWAPKEEVEVPKEILYKEMVYKLTFLIPYNKTIAQLQRSWVGMFLAAVAGTTVYINIDYFNPYDPSARNVLAHELTHILQFLHFRLDFPTTLDEGLAFLTLLEGDAGWTQHLYCNKTRLCTPSPPTRLTLDDLYIALQLFPYIYGEKFVQHLYELGGWDLVNKAYEKPPRSTLMVMRPELYLSYLLNETDLPLETLVVTLDGVSECVYNDTLGSYYIALILAREIGLEKAFDIALNWRGDRVALCTVNDLGVEWVVLWNTTWSSPTYAKYFYNNLTLMLIQKAKSSSIYEKSTLVVLGASESIDHTVVVEVHGVSVFIRSKYANNVVRQRSTRS